MENTLVHVNIKLIIDKNPYVYKILGYTVHIRDHNNIKNEFSFKKQKITVKKSLNMY